MEKETRSSAIADGPRDASCQLKSCQLPRNSAETTCTTSPEQIEVMKLEGYSGTMCNKHCLCAFYRDAIATLPLSYRRHKQTEHGRVVDIACIRYDTIRDAILTGARKPTWVSLIYRTETTTNKKLSYRWGTARCVVSVEILSIATQQYFPLRTTSLAAALSIVQKLLVRQILNQVSAVANWPVRENRAVDSAWRSVR